MQEQYREDEIEIDLKEVLFALLEHWKLIILSTVLVAVITFLISKLLITPMYESTSQLFVLNKSASITSVADIQTGTSLTNDYLVVSTDRPVVEQVIENLGLPENYSELRAKLTVSNPTDSRILKITVADEDSDRAKLIADEMADVVSRYIEQKMDQAAPSVISWGYSDGAPVSPHTIRNTVIGGAGGLILAVAILLVIYLMNDTIMSPEDIEKRLDMHILGTLPLDDGDSEESHGHGRGRKSRHRGKGAPDAGSDDAMTTQEV